MRASRAQDSESYSRYSISPGHFRTLGIPFLAGRDFAATDREGAAPVGIVNDALAHRHWAGENPVGKQIAGIEVVGPGRSRVKRAARSSRRTVSKKK